MALTKVSSSLVSDNAITTGKLVDGGVHSADIATNAVTSTKIAQNSILTKHIDDGQVTTAQLGADAVTAAKIADDAISEEHLDVTVITGLTEVTAATGDLLMVADISDSNNLKKIPVSSILAGTHTGAINTSGTISSGAISATSVGVTNIVTNKVVKFNGSILDDSNITDTGSAITLGSNTTVSGTISSGAITSTGISLFGKTVADNTTNGIRIDGTNDFVSIVRDGDLPLLLNRKTSDGTLLLLRKDGTTVGSIGSEGGDALYIQSGTTSGAGLHMHPTAGNINPARNGAKVDNAIDLGRSTHRFKDLYLSGGALTSTVKFLANTSVSGSDATIFRPADNTMAFSTNGAERLRIDTAGSLLYQTGSGKGYGFGASGSSASVANMFCPAGYTLAFGTNNEERMRIDSAGTIYQDCTSPTLHSAVTGIVMTNGSLITDSTRIDGGAITLAQNLAVDSGNTWAYLAAGEGSYYQQFNGNHYFTTAASGSAGADATTSTLMTINSSGNVGIGTTSPTNISGYKVLDARGSTHGGIFQSKASGNQTARLYVTTAAGYVGTSSNDTFNILTNDVERMQFETNGQINLGTGQSHGYIPAYDQSTGYTNNLNAGSFGILHRNAYDSYITNNTYYYKTGGVAGWKAKYPAYKSGVLSMLDGRFQFDCSNAAPGGSGVVDVSGLAPAVRIDSDGLKFGSDSAAANALDDYEEGTWTPSIAFGGGTAGQSYNRRQGKYIKIGSMVYIQGHLYFTNKGTSTGQASITGIPFPPSSNSAGTFSPLGDRGNLNTGGRGVNAYLHASATSFLLYDGGFDGTANNDTNYGDFNNSTEIDINIVYYTNS